MRVGSWCALTAITLVFPVTGCGNAGTANTAGGNTAGFIVNNRALLNTVSPGRHGAPGDVGAAAGAANGTAPATGDAATLADIPAVRVDAATKTLQIYVNGTAGTNRDGRGVGVTGPRTGAGVAGTRNGARAPFNAVQNAAVHISIPSGWGVNVHNPVNAAWKAALVPYPAGTPTGAGVQYGGTRNIVPDARGTAGVAGVPGTPRRFGVNGVDVNGAGVNGWAGRNGAGAVAGGAAGNTAAGADTRSTWPIPPGAGSTGLRGGAYGDRTDVTSSFRAARPGRYAIVSSYNGQILYVISVT